MNKKAVMYGAGNIGRGFIAQLFYESGYEKTFIDINKELINLINEKKEYPIKFTDKNPPFEVIVKNVGGIEGSAENSGEVSDVISKTDIMAVSVGVNVLKFIMRPVADGINKRFQDNNFAPLNIILCENMIGADKVMRGGVLEYIDEKFKDLYEEKIGFVGVSVGRTVPNQTDEMKSGNPLRIVTESYKTLYADRDAFKGEIPEIKNIVAYSPFEYIIEQKLLIHNMGHAVCAYLGDIVFKSFGYDFIWQSMENPYIKMLTTKTMQNSALALSKIYNADIDELFNFIDSLIQRFANRALGDTVKRVGNDIKRKLAPNDRIIGAYRICSENHVSVKYHCLAIAAAANFRNDNLSGQSLEDILKEAGSYDLLAGNPDDFALVKKFDKAIKDGVSIKNLCDMAGEENFK